MISQQLLLRYTRLTALFPGLPSWAGKRKVKPIWILLKQETVSGSGISWAICKSAPRSRQITMPAPHQSVFYRPDALPAAQPTASKHWRQSATLVCKSAWPPLINFFTDLQRHSVSYGLWVPLVWATGYRAAPVQHKCSAVAKSQCLLFIVSHNQALSTK